MQLMNLLGKIVDIDFHYSYYLPWHLWPFLEEIDRVEIPYNSIHLFDLIRSLFGMPEGYLHTLTHIQNILIFLIPKQQQYLNTEKIALCIVT